MDQRIDDDIIRQELRQIPPIPPTKVVIYPTDTTQAEACQDFEPPRPDKYMEYKPAPVPPPEPEPVVKPEPRGSVMHLLGDNLRLSIKKKPQQKTSSRLTLR